MKKQTGLFMVAALMQIGAAHASESVFVKEIADRSTHNNHLRVEFQANTESPELGRAWLKAYYAQTTMMDTDSVPPKAENIQVPGLSYSAVNKQIIYKQANGSTVVCADNVATSALSLSSYRDTGRCVIETVASTISNDDGFKVKSSPGIKINLKIKD